MKIKKVISFILMGFIGLFTICMLNKTSLAAGDTITVGGTNYAKITTIDELTDSNYIVAGVGSSKTIYMTDVNTSSYMVSTETVGEAVTFEIKASGTGFTISHGGNYISNANIKNKCSFGSTIDIFTVTVSEGVFKFINSAKQYNTLQANIDSPRFACYAGTQTNLTLYKDATPAVTKFDVKYFDGETELTDLTESVEENGFATAPTAPEKTGFIFDGWYTNSNLIEKFSFNETPITGATSIYAKYVEEASATTYTVTYYDTGDSTIEPSVVIEGNAVIKPADPVKEGFAFAGWFTNEDCTEEYEFSAAVNADINLYAKWVQKCVVTFNTDGGTSVASQSVAPGDVAIKPENPTKEGYKFVGWYLDVNTQVEYSFDSKVNSSITLYAKWIDNSIIIFDNMNFKQVTNLKDVTTGYYIIGAKNDGASTVFLSNTNTEGSGKLDSKTEPDTYMYLSVNGTNLTIMDMKTNKYIAVASNLTMSETIQANCNLVIGQTEELFTVKCSNNEYYLQLNVGSKFFKGYKNTQTNLQLYKSDVVFPKVSFYNGNELFTETFIKAGTSITVPTTNPTMPGCKFVGWYKESTLETEFDFNSVINADVNVYAKFEKLTNGELFETYSTQAGLNFHYTCTDGVYSVDNVTLRLGMSGVSIDAYNENATYGILLIQKSEISNTSFHKLISDYKEGLTIAELLELTQDSYDIRNYELTPARVNADGIADPNGDYFQCASVFTDMENDFTTEVAAVAYMELDGVIYIMDDRTTSLSKLAGQYINNPNLTGITDEATLNDILGALEVIKNGGNA